MDVTDNQLDKFLWGGMADGLRLDEPMELYHYTGTDAEADIRKILKCSNANLMEDPLEFRLGLCFLQQDLMPCDFPLKEVQRGSVNSVVRCWTFSMCQNAHDTNMGRKYACSRKGHPVVLAFDYRPMADAVRELMKNDLANGSEKLSLHFLLPCLYSITDYSHITRLIHFLFGEYYKHLCDGISTMDKIEIARACSYLFRSMVKCDIYSGEKEYRLVKITFDGSDEKMVPYGFSRTPEYMCHGFSCRTKVPNEELCKGE